MKKQVLLVGCIAATLLASSIAEAFDTGRRDLRASGRLRQGVSVLYDRNSDGASQGPTNYIAEGKLSWKPNSRWVVTANAWLRGDFFSSSGTTIHGPGLQNFTDIAGGFNSRFRMRLSDSASLGGAVPVFGDDADELNAFDKLDEVIREFSVKYSDPKGRFTVKAGKQQRGWGQSDGLRLLDILHAQDLRERFAFRDSDELRIPAWMVSADINMRRLGIDAPFRMLGMKNTVLEINFIPEIQHSKFVINNPTPSDHHSGGAFGLPFPRLVDPIGGTGLPFIGANLSDDEVSDFSLSSAEWGVRLKFDTLGGSATLNALYGWQDLPLVKFTGANLVVGNFVNNEAAATSVIPLPLATAVGAIHGPGGYLDFLRSGLTAPFPLAPFGCLNPAAPLPGTTPCSVNANFDLDYNERQKVVGFSFIRDIQELKVGRKHVSPVLRMEMSYEFDKPFNRSIVAAPFAGAGILNASGVETGSPALVVPSALSYTHSDTWNTMVGFDFPLWVPGWESQRDSIFLSGQFFNFHTFDSTKGLLAQAPYAFTTVAKDQQFATLLWSVGLDNERWALEGLAVRDMDANGWVYRQRIDYNGLGTSWRPRVEWMIFTGHDPESAPTGVLREADYVEFSLTYQF